MMKKIGFKLNLLRFMLFFGLGLFGNLSAFSKDIVVGLGNFAPYFIEEEERGIFTEIVKEIFKKLPQYKVKYVYMPNERLIKDLNDKKIDAASNVQQVADVKLKSLPIFGFKDQVIALKKNKYSIKSIADLKNKSIITYQRAKFFFGDEFKSMAETNPQYNETPRQNDIAKMLLSDRANVSVGDIYIFLYNVKKDFPGTEGSQFEFFDILPQGFSVMGFNDETLLADFNKAAKQVMDEGTYQKIYDKYLLDLKK